MKLRVGFGLNVLMSLICLQISHPCSATFPPASILVTLSPAAVNSSEWAIADGSLLDIARYPEIFILLGDLFPGGDGVTTFALPDLRERAILIYNSSNHENPPGKKLGQNGGQKQIVLSEEHLPTHRHVLGGSLDQGDSTTPDQLRVLALVSSRVTTFDGPVEMFSNLSISHVGQSQPFVALPPHISMSFHVCISPRGCSSASIPVGAMLPWLNNFNISDIGIPVRWTPPSGQITLSTNFPDLAPFLPSAGAGLVAFPDLRERLSMGSNSSTFAPFTVAGSWSYTLSTSEMPRHSHELFGRAIQPSSGSGIFLTTANSDLRLATERNLVNLSPTSISRNGGSQAFGVVPPHIRTPWILCSQNGGCGQRLPTGTVLFSAARSLSLIGTSWIEPNGQPIPKGSYPTLYNMTRATWGFENDTAFAAPDLRSRFLFGPDKLNASIIVAGAETVQLDPSHMPNHAHALVATDLPAAGVCVGALLAQTQNGMNAYFESSFDTALDSATVGTTGNSAPFSIMPPHTVLNAFVCADDSGCRYECLPCGCISPFIGATCVNTTGGPTWSVGSTAQNSTGGSNLVISTRVIVASNLTILSQNVYFISQGELNITGCLDVSRVSSSFFFDLGSQASLVTAKDSGEILTSIRATCLIGKIDRLVLSGPNGVVNKGSCQTSSLQLRNGQLVILFGYEYSRPGCTPSGAPTIGDLTTGASTIVAVAVSCSVIGVAVIVVLLIILIPNLRKRFLPMMHHSHTEQRRSKETTATR